jgi:hypothetical protein
MATSDYGKAPADMWALGGKAFLETQERAFGEPVGTEDCTGLALPRGHVGVFVGGPSQKLLGPGIAEWLGRHE